MISTADINEIRQEAPITRTKDDNNEESNKEIEVQSARTDREIHFEERDISGPALFDIHSGSNKTTIILNSSHPAFVGLSCLLKDDNNIEEVQRVLRLLLIAWAQIEGERNETWRQRVEDIRIDLGRLVRDAYHTGDGEKKTPEFKWRLLYREILRTLGFRDG